MTRVTPTPRGFKDILPTEAIWREDITNKVKSAISSWGYAPIETPTLEFQEVLAQGGKLGEGGFQLFDSDGALLVLRPDVTLPIARMVALRLGAQLKALTEPLRLRYVQSVFREQESLRGQAREFTQIGVECIGGSGAHIDAEIILLLVDALKASGLEKFTIAICSVSVLRELLDRIVGRGLANDRWQQDVLEACHHNNMVAIAALVAELGQDDKYADALQELLNIRGGREAIGRCKDLVSAFGLSSEMDVLNATYSTIEALGADDHVVVDFSVMSGFDYYTGLVFEAYAPNIGVPLGSGGRYDRMLEAYGKAAPAAGFAFSLEKVMMALAQQMQGGNNADVGSSNVRVEVDPRNAVPAFLEAARLRAEGKVVALTSAPASPPPDATAGVAPTSAADATDVAAGVAPATAADPGDAVDVAPATAADPGDAAGVVSVAEQDTFSTSKKKEGKR